MVSIMDGKWGLKSYFPNRKLGHPTDSKHNECAPFVKSIQFGKKKHTKYKQNTCNFFW
jgi:hypothetical protein